MINVVWLALDVVELHDFAGGSLGDDSGADLAMFWGDCAAGEEEGERTCNRYLLGFGVERHTK